MQKTFNQLKHFLGKLISKIILCCLVLLLGMTLTAYAAVTETPLEQTWYSGQSNSKYFLDFTTEPPTVTCGSPVGQSTGNEGTANFTDPNSGQLKLYTDGISVFNGQTNQVLDNGTGLNGKPSAGEAAMIVPVPGADGDQFYIFTNSIGSVSYSMADLSQGTNGTVTVKNEPLATNTGEALGIVPHSNGTDFWVLVFNTAAKVDAYKVDPSGIASTPVSSNTGYAGNLGRASIIYSPDYNTLALGWAGSRIATAKIDRSTGMISNISQKVTGAVGYATAFSSDGSKLYYALGGQGYSGLPYQIDLNTDVKTKLSTTTAFGGPKLAPDGKIYWTAKNKPALSVVNNPNAVGTAANFALNGLNLKGCYGSWNLPNQTAASLQQINRVPVTDAAIPDQVATEESLFRYPIPADTFSDPDGDELTLSATLSNGDPLPDWLTFDPATNSFSGTPKRPDVGVITLTVTADDGKEGLISTDFKITVNDICHPEEPLNATGAKPCEPSNPCDPNTAIARNTIGFETTPDGATPKDNAALTSSYNDQGTVVTFGFDSNHDLTIDKNAVLESRKDGKGSVVGYTSKGVADIDRTTTKEGGNWLLRAPDGFNVFKNVGTKKQADFLVVYSGTPVQSASGQLWDIDGGEQYKIEALDAKGQVISTILTPGNIPAGEVAGTFDALPYDFSFPDQGQDIGFIRISGVKRIAGGGFAFDNFNATGSKPCESQPEPNPCDPNTAIARNTIGFETTPDGATPKDDVALTSSYNDQGTVVTFGFDSNHDLTIDKNAVLESRKDGKGSVVGYTSKGVADIDRTTTKEGGNWLLRAPDGFNVFKNVGTKKQADFLVVYSGTPVQSASGQLWDIDGGEQYKIEALDAKGQVISTILTPGDIPGGEVAGTFDALPYNFSFPNKGQDISFIRITGVKRIGGGGFAFDNFNATGSQVCQPSNPCDPNKPIPGAFSTIRIGDFDGFGFEEGTGLKSATGAAINVDGTGILSTKDFLPDFNGDQLISNRGEGDPFDNRSDAETAGTYLTGDGFEDMGSKGSDYTDLSLGKVFGYSTSSTYGNSFPDGDPNTLPNTPGFKFHFKVAKDKLPQGTPLFFNVIFGDYDVEPISIIFTNSQGKTVTRELNASAQGKNDGLITSAFATLDFSDVFSDGDSNGEAGYWLGYLDVDFDAPEEPYLSFDFAEIGTKQIPLTPCSGGTTPIEGKIVNIDSTKNLSPETARKLTLPAGTYTLHVIGQADGGNYDAWTRTELIDGCDGNGENCSKGWEHKYFYQLGNTDSVKVDRTDRYSTAEAALANPPGDVSFTLTEETEVDFYVVDGGDPSNNRGGVSLQVISQS